MKIPKRIKEIAVLLLFTYIIAGSIAEYFNTADKTYLILPGIFIVAILIEISARFWGTGQYRGKKPRR